MATKKILVTGSSGMIGTRLCEKLLEKGVNVIGADIRPNQWSKKIQAVTQLVDLRDAAAIEELPEEIETVIHLAANARVYNLVVDPAQALDNTVMVFNLLEFCRKRKIKKFVFASSREVYGNTPKTVCREEDALIENCESPYTASKIAGEALVHSYFKCYGIEYIITRFSNVYGMYDETDRVVPLFIRQCRNNKKLTVFGMEKRLDFTYIDDTVNGIILCIDQFEKAKNDVYNIGTGKAFTIIETAKLIQRNMKATNRITIGKNRTGEVIQFAANTEKAKKRFGYAPQTGFEEGIQKAVEWYQQNA